MGHLIVGILTQTYWVLFSTINLTGPTSPAPQASFSSITNYITKQTPNSCLLINTLWLMKYIRQLSTYEIL